MNLIMVVSIIAFIMIVGTFSNPVPSEAVESDPSHDLETAEVLLEIIEKKIHKLYKKCLKLGGCQPHYHGYSDYGHTSYGYGPSHGGYY